MMDCPDTDALVTIGDALSWEVAEGLRHLQRCADCRARLETLQLTRSVLTEAEAVDAALLARISDVVGAEARSERGRGQKAQRWASAVEALLAGIAAPAVLITNGIEIGSVAAGALTFVLGAAFVIYGRKLRLYAV